MSKRKLWVKERRIENEKIILFSTLVLALNSCSIYKSYERSEEITTDGVYRDVATDTITNDTTNFGDLPWRELFRDPLLQGLIEEGLANNVDLQTAILRVDQASAQLLSAKLSYLPSLNLTPQISVTGDDGTTIAQSYEIPVSASWEIDLLVICSMPIVEPRRHFCNKRPISKQCSPLW